MPISVGATLFLFSRGRSDGGNSNDIPVLLDRAMKMIGQASGNKARTVGEAQQWTKTVRRGQASEVKPRVLTIGTACRELAYDPRSAVRRGRCVQ